MVPDTDPLTEEETESHRWHDCPQSRGQQGSEAASFPAGACPRCLKLHTQDDG